MAGSSQAARTRTPSNSNCARVGRQTRCRSGAAEETAAGEGGRERTHDSRGGGRGRATRKRRGRGGEGAGGGRAGGGERVVEGPVRFNNRRTKTFGTSTNII